MNEREAVTALKRLRKNRRQRFDLALADLCCAIAKMERETGGNFKFHMTWEPPVTKPRPEKDKP